MGLYLRCSQLLGSDRQPPRWLPHVCLSCLTSRDQKCSLYFMPKSVTQLYLLASFRKAPRALHGLLTLVVLEHFLCVCSNVNAKGSHIKSDFDLSVTVICYT